MALGFSKILRTLRRAKGVVLRQYRIKTDPVGYARSLGVRWKKAANSMACVQAYFSTEPWLISIGNNVHITAECQFITHDGGTLIVRKEVPDLELTFPITIGDDVYIGIRTIILPGVKIGSRSIIAASSAVSRDIPDNSVAAGVPARVIKTTDAYMEKAKSRSLHIGHLSKIDKEAALMALYGVQPPALSEVEE